MSAELLKVAFCHYGGNRVSGPGSWLRRILPRLQQYGIEPVSIQFLQEPGDSSVSADLCGMGIAAREVRGGAGICEGIHALTQVFAEERPAVIVADHVRDAFLASTWARTAGIPSVLVLRSDDGWYRQLLNDYLFGPESYRVEGVVAVSHELEKSVLGRIPVSVEMLRCPSSVPIPESTAQWCSGRFRAVYLGRFDIPQKRIMQLVDALVAASRARPWFEAVLYGDGPARHEVIARLAGEKGHRVSCGSVLNPDEVQERLVDAQALVLFSAYEGLSTAVQEAMACGLPVIVRRTASGMEGVLIDGETALVLDEDEGLGAAIDALAGSQDLWRRLSSEVRNLAEREFSIDQAARQWAGFLDRLRPKMLPESIGVPDIAAIKKRCAQFISGMPCLDEWNATLAVECMEDWGGGLDSFVKAGTNDADMRRYILSLALDRKIVGEANADVFFRDGLPDPELQPLFWRGIKVGCIPKVAVLDVVRKGAGEWELRRRLFYLVLSEGLIGREEAASIAKSLLSEADESPEDSLEHRYNLASLAELAGENDPSAVFTELLGDEAARHFHAGCRFHLGRIALSEGRSNEAVMHLQACLALEPGHGAADRLLRNLNG